MVVIDALDESGDDYSREHILQVVTMMGVADPPAHYRVLVTSRPLLDICNAFHNVGHIKTLSLDDNSYAKSTMIDIAHYVQTKLSQLNYAFNKTDVEQLTAMSDGLFEWARLACEFIRPRKAGINAKRRFNDLISRAHGRGSALLDQMYINILSEIVDDSDEGRAEFRCVAEWTLLCWHGKCPA
ncbi:hypothetical protein ID866_9872 [Astraeus odoratus]|nr:hypothetical protein ID866_9872 [Astraeus odoratus]